MKKSFLHRALASLLALSLLLGILPPSAFASEGGGVDTLSDENLQILVDRRNGGFSIRTLEGDAIQKDDNNKNLLFPLGEDDTSFLSVRITRDGKAKDYVFGGDYEGASPVEVTAATSQIQAVWEVDDVRITQTFRLANPGSTEHGMAYLSYTAENLGAQAQVELRLLMDTALGTQDYGVYEVAQDNGYTRVTSEQTVTDYQNNFFAYDDPQNPSIMAYFLNGTVGDTVSKPEKVTFGHWNNLAASVFDYAPDGSLDFTTPYNRDYLTADSAFALYYDLGTLAQNGSGSAAGYYGVFSNADVPETAGATLNFTDMPETLTMDTNGTAYTNNGDFTVQGTFRNISGGTLDNVRLVVYPGEKITPYDQNNALQTDATYWDPYYLELTNLQDQGSQNVNFKFQATPGEEATYRKLTFQAYKMEDSSTVLQAKNLLCTETVWILCPGTNGNVPEIGFTSASPDLIYATGTRSLYLTGANFNILESQQKSGAFTLRLSRTDGGTIDGKESIEIEKDAFAIDAENNTAQVVLTQELDIGEYQLTIDYLDAAKTDIAAPALRFQVTDDPEYRNNGYGVVTVEQDSDKQYSVHTYATEKDYADSGKSLGGAVLLEFRGSFSQKEESGTKVYTAVSLGKEDNVITLNNCLDIRDGQVTITDQGGVIEVDFDASLLISGVGTSVWTGPCCLTAIEDGTAYSLTTYEENGDRNQDGNITLLWPSVGQAAQDLLGLLFEFKYGEMGYMDGVGGVIAFGGGLDLSFLVPAAKQSAPEASALDKAKQDLIAKGQATPDNLRALEDQYPHNADTVDTNAPPFETSTDMGDSAEAGDGDSRSATIQVDDILFGGGQYQGVNFSVALGLPSYIDGMPGIEGVLTVKTVGDWAVGVSGAASFATFAMEAELAIQSKDGIPYPDTLRFYVGGFTPGINLDGMGVLWLQGAGGGIDNLYDTIFLTDAIPPLQLILQGQFSILQIISARAELDLSLQGIGAQLSNGTLANSVAVLDSAQLELGWYPEVYFLAALNMNIAGILQGGGYIVSDEAQLFEFFIQAALTLPGNLPLIGGLTLVNVGLGANTEKIWGAAEALGMKVGITYYWGGDISWNGEEATSSHPELMTFRAVPLYTSPTTGKTLYAAVGNNVSVAARAQVVSSLNGPTTFTGGDSLKSNISGLNHQLTLENSASDGALSFTWESASEAAAIEEGKKLSIQASDGSNYPMRWLDPKKDANAPENQKANAHVYYDEKSKQAHMTATFPAGTQGTYAIATNQPSDLTFYRLAPLPELKKVEVSGNRAMVTGTDLSKFSQITLLAVDGETAYPVGSTTDTITGDSVEITLDTAALPSGTYTLRAVAVDADATTTSTAETSWTYENPRQPAKPTVSNVKSAGDYKVSFTASGEGIDGYRVSFYEGDQLVSGVSGLMLEKGSSTYTAGGQATVPEYQTDKEGQLLLDDKGYPIATGETTVGLEAGKTYKMGVSAYKVTSDGVTLYSEETRTDVTVSAPNPPTFSWDADVKAVTETTQAGKETFETLIYPKNSFTATITEAKGQKVSGTWSLDGGEETEVTSQSRISLELKNLTEGSHTIRFQGTNSQGDAFRYTKSFTVDSTPPALMISTPNSGSFFSASTQVTGRSEGTLTISVDGGAAEPVTIEKDGSFTHTVNLSETAASHTLTLTATDGVGNRTSRTLQLVNPALGQLKNIVIYADGQPIQNHKLEPTSSSTTLSAVAVLENGSTLSLTGSRLVEWEADPATGTFQVNDQGQLTLSAGSSGLVHARLRATDQGAYSAYALVSGENINPTITCTAGAGGSVSISAVNADGTDAVICNENGVYQVKSGSTVTIRASASSGYTLATLSVNGTPVPAANGTYQVENIRDSLTVHAAFQAASIVPGGGDQEPHYPITSPSQTEGGKITITPQNASPGKTVTITSQPEAGYELGSLIVTDQKGSMLTLTPKGDGSFTFRMPGGPVKVEALFVPQGTGLGFVDVSIEDYYYDAVQWALEKGITNGITETTFGPHLTCTRAQAVTFLWRLAGSPAPQSQDMPFADVTEDAYYRTAVQWAVEQGITNGVTATVFAPDQTVSRSQMVTFLHRFSQSPAPTIPSGFADVKPSDYYYNAVQWALEKGITNGTSDTAFSPDLGCNRGQMVTFLYRFTH